AGNGGTRFDLNRLRCRHRDLRPALVLHTDDAPRLSREVDPRVQALASIAADDRGRTVWVLHVDPATEAIAGDLGDADRIVVRGVVARHLIRDDLAYRVR